MPFFPRSLLAMAISSLTLPVLAQTPDTVDLGDIDIVGQVHSDTQTAAAYATQGSLDSGSSVISESVIRAKQPGDMDTTELLKSQPFVQMDIHRESGDPREIQSLRPSDFAISGGNYYNNTILVNGVSVNAIMDVTEDNPYHYNEVSGQSAQTLYIDPNLVGEIIVRDSNVSAEYGDFSGGVVEYNVRQPSDRFSLLVSTGYQSDGMVDFKLDNDDKPATATDRIPEPEFTKQHHAVTVDLPISDDFKVLAAYSRAESRAQYQAAEAYGSRTYHNGDRSENFLLKGVYTLSDDLIAEGQMTYTPYESEAANPIGINNLVLTHSDGLSAYLKLSGTGTVMDWETQLSYSLFDSSREASRTSFSWPSAAAAIDWCSSSNCSAGGYGDIDQQQEDYALSFKGMMPLGAGELAFGALLSHTEALKQRAQENRGYSRGQVFSQLDCPSGDPACIANQAVLEQYNLYLPYKAKVEVDSQALWAEYRVSWQNVSVRTGLRYSHEGFLDNHNLAPRLSAAWEFIPGASVTLGANRYYDKTMVAYAIREQYPDSFIYRRDTTTDGGGVEQVSDWALYSYTRPNSYNASELDTPYADELSLTFTVATPWQGELRVRGLKRAGRDQFASSASELLSYEAIVNGVPRNLVYANRVATNDGRTDYEALSVEWQARFGQHLFAINGTWSETRSYGGAQDYFDEVDDESLADDQIYYQDRLISEKHLSEIQDRANFATPFRAYASLTSRWWNDRLLTNLSVHYRGNYERIDDSSANIVINGVRYDIYERLTRQSFTSVDFNTQLTVLNSDAGTVSIDAKLTNLLNEMPYTDTTASAPYQQGRTLWLGATYQF